MAAADQAKNLLPGVKPPVPEALKGLMEEKTILNFTYYCELYFSLVSISNRKIQSILQLGCYGNQHILGLFLSSIY